GGGVGFEQPGGYFAPGDSDRARAGDPVQFADLPADAAYPARDFRGGRARPDRNHSAKTGRALAVPAALLALRSLLRRPVARDLRARAGARPPAFSRGDALRLLFLLLVLPDEVFAEGGPGRGADRTGGPRRPRRVDSGSAIFRRRVPAERFRVRQPGAAHRGRGFKERVRGGHFLRRRPDPGRPGRAPGQN